MAADQPVTITYDVTGTTLQGLDEAWLWLWLPDNSDHTIETNINPASDNSTLTDKAKFTRETGPNGEVYFSITLTLTDFTNEPKEDINTVGVLIKGNDWSNGQSTDYLFETSDGFTLIFDNPSGSYGFYDSGETIEIRAKTSESAAISLFIDDNLVSSAEDATSLNFDHPVIEDGLVHTISATATNSTEETVTIDYNYTLEPTSTEQALPDGLIDGINYDDADPTKASLVLTAPDKDFVFVIGSFNDWSIDQDFLMNKDGDKFWIEISNLDPGKEYLFQYLVDGEIRIADPYAEKISSQFDDGQVLSEQRYENLLAYPASETSEAAGYLQTNQSDFEWEDFTPPNKDDLIVYELLVRDFTDERTYDALLQRLDYLEDLGINALELMPVMEFEGNISWGYNPSSMLAVDKYYGTEEDLKTVINECHKRGIAVIFDIVLNHQFGRNSLVRLYNQDTYGAPTSDNPWFNVTAKHDFNVGYDMNHDSEHTREYFRRVVRYWIEEYNIDGYRFDLSKGFTQKNTLGNVEAWGNYDAERVALWKQYADYIWSIDPDNYVILEHFADNDEEKELADYGMMIWGNMNQTYRNAVRGGSTSFSWLYHESRGWNNPHAIGYMESHDEERVMWTLLENAWELPDAVERAKLATAFFLTVPGPKMIWQFGEFGYDEELNNDRLGIKPTRWEYLDDPSRITLFEVYKSLTNLRTKTDYIDSEYFNWSTSGWVKWITIEHPDVNFYIVGNFNLESQTSTHNFPKSGTWYNYFTGASVEITDANAEFNIAGGKFFIYTDKEIDNFIDSNPIVLGELEDLKTGYFYPNPTQNEVRFSADFVPEKVVIRSLSGQVLQALQPNDNRLELGNLSKGIYFLEMIRNDQRITRKVIIH